MDDVVDLVRDSLTEAADEEFSDRVDKQAEKLREAIAAGQFDNEDFAVGLEVEVYAIDAEPEPIPESPDEEEDGEGARDDGSADDAGERDGPAGDLSGGDGPSLDADLSDVGDGGSSWDGSLEPGGSAESDRGGDPDADDEEGESPPPDRREPYMDPEDWEGRLTELPEAVFEGLVAKELGVHNAEINTEPDQMGATGLEVQTASVEMRVKKARDAAAAENCELVLDAMWTIPPEEGSKAYLSAHEERDGVVIAENMRRDPRYVAIDNDAVRHAGGQVPFSVPGAEHEFPTILFESLATSIQPHLQIPSSAAFPSYYNAAIRTLGPVLALTTNSPFLPTDLYNRVDDPYDLLSETHHELRIAAFEQSVNTTENPKVRVPDDVETTIDVVDGVVDDDCFAPFLREWLRDDDREDLADHLWEFDHKRGTFWRWLRCVVGGEAVDGAGDEQSLRIEYRPIPTQPSVDDLVAAQTLTVGLIRGLVDRNHPLAELPWQEAKRSFYGAARNGLDADLAWVTADGARTTAHDVIYDEIFEVARHGLSIQGVPENRIDEWLDPLERRAEARATPSAWKIDRVRTYLDDGEGLEDAIQSMQLDYRELSHEHRCFADWL